jgi:hypothetical protein
MNGTDEQRNKELMNVEVSGNEELGIGNWELDVTILEEINSKVRKGLLRIG